MPAHLAGRPVQNAGTEAVEALIAARGLATFRSFDSFACTISLFFHSRTMEYFVTFHQEGRLRYALKATDPDAAGAAFAHFEELAVRLSDGEVRRAQLIAQNAELVRQIEESEAQARRLHADLQRRTEQEHQVNQRIHQVRREAAQLEAQRIAAQAQLNKAHRAVRQLEIAGNEAVLHLHGR